MKIRQHRGSLAESMRTVVEIEPTMKALRAEVERSMGPKAQAIIEVKPYGRDERIGWDTHIVLALTVDGWGVFGFTDGPVKDA